MTKAEQQPASNDRFSAIKDPMTLLPGGSSSQSAPHLYRYRIGFAICVSRASLPAASPPKETACLVGHPGDPCHHHRAVGRDRRRWCLLHGGAYDVGCIKRDYQVTLTNFYDTQEAALLVGVPKTGWSLVELATAITKSTYRL